MAKKKSQAQLDKEAKAKARGHAAGEYHFGRINTIRDENNAFYSYRTGPVPDPSGESYKGARGATLEHVIKMLNKPHSKRWDKVTVSVYGRFGSKPEELLRFRWIGKTFTSRQQLITDIQVHIDDGSTPEEAVTDLFDLDETHMPTLILAWEVRPAK